MIRELELFIPTYDNRSPSWFHYSEEMFFPYDPSYGVNFATRGYAAKNEVLYVTFRLYEGSHNDGQSVDGLKMIYETTDNIINCNADGFFYNIITAQVKLGRPVVEGSMMPYTATMIVDDETKAVSTFVVSNCPTLGSDIFRCASLSASRKRRSNGEADVTVRVAMEPLLDYPLSCIISAYHAWLAPDEELYGKTDSMLPVPAFNVVDLRAAGKGEQTVDFVFELPYDDAHYHTDEQEETIVFAIAGKTFLRVPVSHILNTVLTDTDQFLVRYPDTSDANGTALSERLMPADFRDMLAYLDRRRVFDFIRNADSKTWKHRHLVLTGKRGTGKRTAAHQFGLKLIEAGIVSKVTEIDAIEMYDSTNGYSPKVEETLEQNEESLLIVTNAEQLTLKGTVGSLTGIEILASKLRKMQTITVVLIGRRGQMEELVKMCEPARDLFYTFYDFADVEPQLMTQLTTDELRKRGYSITEEATQKLEAYFERAYSLRGNTFTNMYFAWRTIDDEILPRMVRRIVSDNQRATTNLIQVEEADIPVAEQRDPTEALAKLESLIGLDNVKQSIINHTALVRQNKIRADRGLYNRMPPMHMVFTGNPGTGKTTIAEYLGEIYRGIGALSSGHLVQTDRSKLVGQYIGDTEKNTLNAIQRASGGVLFIDEAYNLFIKADDNRDFGMRVIETLLTYLSMEDTDMIVILAGYTNEMKALIESNPGLKSRFPYIFHFEDYSPDQLLRIAKLVLHNEQYTITPEAEEALAQYIVDEYNDKDEHFGNGRFVTRLLRSHIIPAMSQRLSKMAPDAITDEALSRIELVDIPRHGALTQLMPVDESILQSTLRRLDALVGVSAAKKALHDYVTTIRLERQADAPSTLNLQPASLCWNFIGNTGTGKSTVAEILGKLMQGLGLLKRGHTVVLNIEELTTNDMYTTLEKAVTRAADGLLFMDMDSPHYRQQHTDGIRLWIANKIKETRQHTAVVFAETAEAVDAMQGAHTNNGIASLSRSVIFDDFTAEELFELLRHMLHDDYRLDIDATAAEQLRRHTEQLHSSSSRQHPVNARTVQLLAQTLAQQARLRIAREEEAAMQSVTVDDVALSTAASSPSISRIGF